MPNIIEFRLINLFTAASTTEMREEVLAEFRKQNTRLRLVIATSAFGLGVDCPDIGRVINWGAPNITEELEQQSGRAGRDDSQAEAILYYKKQENTFPKPQKNMVKMKRDVTEPCCCLTSCW